MSTHAHNNTVSGGHCAVVLGIEHARTIADQEWTRSDIRRYLWNRARVRFGDIAFEHRYGQVYNRNLPKWYGRDLESMNPVVPSADNLHLFVAGGESGRFSAFVPGWGHMSEPVLRSVEDAGGSGGSCTDDSCSV